MKASSFTICIFFLLCCALPAAAQVDPVAVPSRIESVTVFADRAQVTRGATISLKPGNNLVSIENLPILMAEESLRAEGKGTGRARISGITVEKDFLDRSGDKRIRELEDQIKALTRKVEAIEARRKGLSSQRAFLDSIKAGWSERISKELGSGKPAIGELNEAARFVGKGVTEVEEQLYEAEASKQPLIEKITALQLELGQHNSDRRKEVRSVVVAIEAEREMKFDLDLSYVVYQAAWTPTYDVRLAPDGKAAELVYRAQVWQTTGEAWPGVKLALSTARPELGGGAPQLFPWHISFYEPPRENTFGSSKRFEMPMAAPAPAPAPVQEGLGNYSLMPDIPAVPVQAGFAEGQTSVLFQVPQRVDIPADGTRAGSVIVTEKVPVTAEYETVPKLSQRVYLKSKVLNNTPYPLLPGEVNIFNDVVFVGKSHLKPVAAGEEFDLYFGSDDQVKVKRESVRVKKKAGLIGSNSVTYRVSIELQNFKNHPVTVSVLDQKPIPGNAEIKVSLEDAQPKPAETKDDGTMVWKVDLAPGEKKKIGYDLIIEYPKGRDLVGLE